MIDLSSAIVLGPPKEAALYFERVLPADLGGSVSRSGLSEKEKGLHIPLDGVKFDEKVLTNLTRQEGFAEHYRALTNLGVIFRYSWGLFRNKDLLDQELDNPSAKVSAFFKLYGYDYQTALLSIKAGSFDFDKVADRLAKSATVTQNKLGFSNSIF